MHARNIVYIDDHERLLTDAARIEEVRRRIAEGDVYIARGVGSEAQIKRIREYLTGVGRNSLPAYHPIQAGCPNFHRLNNRDERAYVQGCFHQFVFFPWNQDVFDLFKAFRSVYQMKNLLSGLPANKFLEGPEEGCTARLAFQFYPRGAGALNKHQDPVDRHQLTVPTMLMSQKGVDFQAGGAYVERADGSHFILDDVMRVGDVVYFNAQARHGVEKIDPQSPLDWLSFQGRWMLLFAINKLSSEQSVGNSVDLEARS